MSDDILDKVFALLSSVNDSIENRVCHVKQAAQMLNAAVIELDKAWVPGSQNRHQYTDWSDILASVPRCATDAEFLAKAGKKAKNRNIIFICSDFWGINAIEIYGT
jgi:hypothetical protein